MVPHYVVTKFSLSMLEVLPEEETTAMAGVTEETEDLAGLINMALQLEPTTGSLLRIYPAVSAGRT